MRKLLRWFWPMTVIEWDRCVRCLQLRPIPELVDAGDNDWRCARGRGCRS